MKHFRLAVYHPATNGAMERFVKTLKTALKMRYLEREAATKVLEWFLFEYCTVPHAVTGTAPSELFLGSPLCTALDLLRPKQKERVEEQQAEQKQYHDVGKRNVSFEVQDKVMVRVYH